MSSLERSLGFFRNRNFTLTSDSVNLITYGVSDSSSHQSETTFSSSVTKLSNLIVLQTWHLKLFWRSPVRHLICRSPPRKTRYSHNGRLTNTKKHSSGVITPRKKVKCWFVNRKYVQKDRQTHQREFHPGKRIGPIKTTPQVLLHNKGIITVTFTTDWYLRVGERRDKITEWLKKTSVRSTDQKRMFQRMTYSFPTNSWRQRISKGRESDQYDL